MYSPSSSVNRYNQPSMDGAHDDGFEICWLAILVMITSFKLSTTNFRSMKHENDHCIYPVVFRGGSCRR